MPDSSRPTDPREALVRNWISSILDQGLADASMNPSARQAVMDRMIDELMKGPPVPPEAAPPPSEPEPEAPPSSTTEPATTEAPPPG